MSRYADIVLPLAQPTYTFLLPQETQQTVQEGDAVAVQFGPKNIYTGIVWRLHDTPPQVKRIKSIGRKLYPHRILDEKQMRLWEWMADYYMCSLGEVMRMALPSLIKPRGSSDAEFSAEEFHPRTEYYVALAEAWRNEELLAAECDRIGRRAPKRSELLRMLGSFDKSRLNTMGEIPRRLIECDMTQLRSMCKAGYITLVERERSVERQESVSFITPRLTAAQSAVVEQIRASQQGGKSVHLLRGITGSGKTEIYMTLIAEVLARGGDVLYLVPEIALSSQLIGRLESVFGSRVTAYHSKLTALRRSETFLRLAGSKGGELVIGARSALFLPMRHLQLVVVDEEHDQSYKQSDSAPRYHGRDSAIVLASLYGAHTLLGSATPSLESYSNALGGKFGYSYLAERYGDACVPRIIISDTMRSVKRGERRGHINIALAKHITEALQRGEQVMLFQNRRGFSPFISCRECGWTMRCPNCNVTLTLHRSSQRMECHYCGHTAAVPRLCPHCQVELSLMGFGTERVEESVAQLFPEARVARLDRDTSTSESAYNAIIRNFESGQTDILVGTQMITKGFDFERVSVVGILNADNLLCNPDFRASERAFQLMTQVAGRAGRRNADGVVVIQTSEPDNPVIGWVADGNYEAMARSELAERHAFCYPPYSRLVQLTMRDGDRALLHRAAGELAAQLRKKFGGRLFGPVIPPVDKVRGLYIMRLLLKIESGRSMARARELIREALGQFATSEEFKAVNISIDVDVQ